MDSILSKFLHSQEFVCDKEPDMQSNVSTLVYSIFAIVLQYESNRIEARD